MNNNKITSKNLTDVGYKTLFSGDAYLMHVHKKSHGISRAVYLISDFFDDNEPIKYKMRTSACDLVEYVLSLSTELSPERKRLLDNIIKTGLALISYSEISMFSGIASEMNHVVLSTEIESLISVIEDREMPSRLGRHFVLDDAFFAKEPESENENFQIHNKSAPLGNSGFSSSYNNSRVHKIPNLSGQLNKNKNSNPNHNSTKKISALSNSEVVDQRKNDRRSSILSVIKIKGNPSIKDIAEVVKDCSEKTIQRELLDMVALGILRKEGERRWSRYSLVV